MKKLGNHVVAAFATCASLVALVYSVKEPERGFDDLEKFFLLIAMGFFVLDVTLALSDYIRRPTRRFSDGKRQRARIRDFMHKWLEQSGRTVIFSRDLSWVDGSDVKLQELLRRKAIADELTIVLPEHIELTRTLEHAGATVVTYPGLDYVIQSRFTMVGVGRVGARVAIGHSENDAHVIEVMDSSHPAFYLAEDLVEVMKRV